MYVHIASALHAACPLLLWHVFNAENQFHYIVYNVIVCDKIWILPLLCMNCGYNSDVQFVCKSENTFRLFSVFSF